ncbi:nuclear transport factor 2 family protein [Geodermatophilus sp. SYSU D00691]
MRESPELAALVERIYTALADGEVAWLSELLSSSGAALVIGTDPAEWYEGATIRRRWLEQMDAGLDGARYEVIRVRAHEEGDVGWVADETRVVMPDGPTVTMRSTAVFHREDGSWRLLHGHSSVGVPNEAALGLRLPT